MKRITILILLIALAGTFFLMNYLSSDNNSVYTDFTISYSEDVFAPAIDYNRINYAKSVSKGTSVEPTGTSLQLPQVNSSVDLFGKSSNAKVNSGSSRTRSSGLNFYTDNSSTVNKNRNNPGGGYSNGNIGSSSMHGLIASHVSGATNRYTPIGGGPNFTSTNDLYNSNSFADDDDEDGFEQGADNDDPAHYNDTPVSGVLPALFIALGYALNIAIRRRRKD
jgi:hypothetical protein